MKPLWIIALIALFLGLINTLIGLEVFFRDNSKVAWVDLNELYNNYELTKKRQVEYEGLRNRFQNKLDSLRMLDQLDGEGEPSNLTLSFAEKVKASEEGLMATKDRFETEIWKQLNEHVSRFGQEYDYGVILGAKSDGGIMHGDSTLNITKDLIEFANQKYLNAGQ